MAWKRGGLPERGGGEGGNFWNVNRRQREAAPPPLRAEDCVSDRCGQEGVWRLETLRYAKLSYATLC